MSRSFKAGLLAAAAAALLSSPSLSLAALANSVLPSPAAAAPQASALAALDFLTQAVANTASASDTAHESAVNGGVDADDQRAFKLGVGQLITPPAHLRGDVDLFLWNLLGIVHAHRHGRPFELADRGVEFVLSHHANQPSAVPLPGALWLFVMGVLGLAGTRITGVGGSAGVARERPPTLPTGAAVAA